MKKRTNEPNTSQVPASRKKKKRQTGILIFFLILIILAGAASAYYYSERQKPQKAAETFMHTIQALDFDAMTSLIQTEDLTLLDEADIRGSAYTDFFRSMCEKITYHIVKTDFHLTSGTAEVTVRINYPDGSEIYKAASSDFLRQVAAASFSGTAMSEEDLTKILADTLIAAEEKTETGFLVTEVTYPMIALNNSWKIKNLDSETLKVLSCNFGSVEEEFADSVAAAHDGKQVSIEAPIGEEERIDMDTDRFRIRYTQYRIAKDISGKSCLLVYYEYTNKNADSAACPMLDVNLQAYQTGSALEAAIPETTEEALDMYMEEVAPSQTVTVCQAFSLIATSEVTLKASDAFTFGGETTSQLLKLE